MVFLYCFQGDELRCFFSFGDENGVQKEHIAHRRKATPLWKAINSVSPRVVIIEYNAMFPPSHEWVMPYNASHLWDGGTVGASDNMGASLKSLELLGEILGYRLVGTNVNGLNAFFVRKDLAKDLFVSPPSAEKLYNPSRYNIVYRNRFISKAYIGP